jgi:hypothetical protein
MAAATEMEAMPGDEAEEGSTEPGATAGDAVSSGPATDEEGTPTAEDGSPTAAAVADRYDFEDFGPADMRRMDLKEWEAAFDPDSWVTGPALLDRVEDELRSRVADREVFAVVERPEETVVLAYSEQGYARVEADGTVEGSGTVLRDVKPTVALCSMPEYEVADPPANASLPDPASVPESGSQLGNWMLQAIAATMILAGVVLLAATVLASLGTAAIVALVAGVVFLGGGTFLFAMVANARLAGRFRAEEFRNRLRAAGVEDAERPAVFDEADSGGPREEE